MQARQEVETCNMRGSFIILIALLASSTAWSQLCTGSLGDPVVHITFGAGGNPGPSLAPGITNYIFVTSDCPPDGYYALRNASSSCFGNTWFNITDHTGDPNGYFMLVNAAFQHGDFFVDTVSGLCTNTTYEFAAWVINILKQSACGFNGINPNLTFNIETIAGTVLATY